MKNEVKRKNGGDDILVKRFLSLISLINEEHLSICGCYDDEIKTEYIKLMKDEMLELENKKMLDNIFVMEQIKSVTKHKALKEVAKRCIDNDIRCPFEQEEMFQTVKLFNEMFDLNDPRVFTVVKSVLSHQLSVYRMQLQSNYKGILQRVEDEYGNTTFIINPVEEEKRKLDDSIIIAIEKLNKIINGERNSLFNTNINIDWNDLIQKMENGR